MQILTFIQEHSLLLLDITSTTLGLIYLWLEYRASIWLWLVSIIMPAIDTVLYFKAGLYADFGRAIYYCLAAAYGYIIWRCGKKGEEKELPISHFPHEIHSALSASFYSSLGCYIFYSGEVYQFKCSYQRQFRKCP